MEEIMKDDRFSVILKDPRYKKIPTEDKKIKIDKRFQSMFKDKNFKLKYIMDKRGRPVNYTTSENLKKFYEMSSSESSSEESSDEVTNCEKAPETSDHTSHKEVQTNVDISSKENQNLPFCKQEKGKKKTYAEEKNKKGNRKELYCCVEEENIGAELKVNSKKQGSLLDSRNTDTKRKVEKEDHFDDINCTESETSTFNDSDVEQDNKRRIRKEMKLNSIKNTSSTNADTSDESDSEQDNKRRLKKEVRFNDVKSSSETETSSSDSDIEHEDEIDHKWGELDRDAPPAVEITNRLAVCNMDWDRIQTQDLFVLFNSFKPIDGIIKSVKIYPSEYGLKRMKGEEIHGPTEIVEKTLTFNNEGAVEESEDKFSYKETVRQYQLNRLKYYYAVVECDTPETANTLYEELDGMEYENSGVHLDLRFIPNNFVFAKEVCTTNSLPDPLSYKPSMFESSALAQTTVNLTWDETDPKRKEIIEKAFADPENPSDDVLALIAPPGSDSSENEEDLEKVNQECKNGKLGRIALYRSLLQSLDEKDGDDNDEDIDMEITFEPGLKEKAEKLVKEKQKEENLTPFEQYLQKKKGKQKLKKKERKAKLKEESELTNNSDSEYSYEINGKSKSTNINVVSDGYEELPLPKKQESVENERKLAELALMASDQKKKTTIKAEKKKIKKKKEPKENDVDDFEFNVKDPRFAALYTSHLFNIDPSDPHYKDTKGMRAILEEKRKRKEESSAVDKITAAKHSKLSEESLNLLKSVKKKMNK